MNIDIEIFNTIENRKQLYTKQWRTIYKIFNNMF